MKRITVNAYEIALIMKRGKLIEVLTEGKHWIGFCKEVYIYDMTKPLELSTPEMVLIAESYLVDYYLTVVSIHDTELGIEMQDGNYTRVLGPGKVGYWHSDIRYTVDKVNISNVEATDSIPKYLLMKPEIVQYLKVYPVESYQKGLLYIDGKFIKMLDPGVYYYWKAEVPAVVKTVDTRLQYLEVSGQELLTKDKAGIRVNFSAQYQVKDIQKALVDAVDYQKQLYTSLQLSLRAYIGTMTLDQLLANKESIGPYIMNAVKESAEVLGVEVLSGGIKDIILPGDIKEIMNQVLVAQKKAQANTIMRQEETASTRSLLNTAKLMEDNAMLLKLKEMEYMEKISEKIGEITVNGGSGVIDQLKQLVVAK